eukprot:13890087-Ditylum_brightwellii.AAC.1
MIDETWVLDSGSNDHMCNKKEYFTTLQQSPVDYFTLGDRKTRLPCKGVGTVQIQISKYVLRLINILFVPDLDCSLYSIKRHMRLPGYSQHADDDYTLAFPTFLIHADIQD